MADLGSTTVFGDLTVVGDIRIGGASVIDTINAGDNTTEGQLARRQRAYVAESDPLFLEWQYDKTPESEQVWRDKVAEIKLCYPVARGAEE